MDIDFNDVPCSIFLLPILSITGKVQIYTSRLYLFLLPYGRKRFATSLPFSQCNTSPVVNVSKIRFSQNVSIYIMLQTNLVAFYRSILPLNIVYYAHFISKCLICQIYFSLLSSYQFFKDIHVSSLYFVRMCMQFPLPCKMCHAG